MPEKITEETLQMLDALCGVIVQYLPEKDGLYAHQNMSAGEDACDVLIKYGLAYDDGYSIVPNDKFKKLEYIEGHDNQAMLDFLNKEEA